MARSKRRTQRKSKSALKKPRKQRPTKTTEPSRLSKNTIDHYLKHAASTAKTVEAQLQGSFTLQPSTLSLRMQMRR
jgi:hypothetical protein